MSNTFAPDSGGEGLAEWNGTRGWGSGPRAGSAIGYFEGMCRWFERGLLAGVALRPKPGLRLDFAPLAVAGATSVPPKRRRVTGMPALMPPVLAVSIGSLRQDLMQALAEGAGLGGGRRRGLDEQAPPPEIVEQLF